LARTGFGGSAFAASTTADIAGAGGVSETSRTRRAVAGRSVAGAQSNTVATKAAWKRPEAMSHLGHRLASSFGLFDPIRLMPHPQLSPPAISRNERLTAGG
jgi:hypothetical protein